MKKALAIILSVIMLISALPMLSLATDFQLTIKMKESFGDGWNDAKISIYEVSDGVESLVGTATIPAGKEGEYTTTIKSDSNYVFKWTKGRYDYECSFEVVVSGTTVYTASTSTCRNFANNEQFYERCAKHEYSSDCDTTCNVCFKTRTTTVAHPFIALCEEVCSLCGAERTDAVAHTIESNGDIKNDVICTSCNKAAYEASDRWTVGEYYGRTGNKATMAGYGTDYDTITSYLVMDTVPGEKYSLSFSWAICQGFTDYGEFYLKFYHNDNQEILHDFTRTANPYSNILDETYTFTAEGEQQVFKWVFEKVDEGHWADGGRPIYLGDIAFNHSEHTVIVDEAVAATCTETGLTEGQHCLYCDEITVEQEVVSELGHDIVIDEAVAATCTETGLTEGQHCSRCEDKTIEQEITPILDHVDADDDTYCDVGGEQLFCEDCGRPVHEGLVYKIICALHMLVELVKSFAIDVC